MRTRNGISSGGANLAVKVREEGACGVFEETHPARSIAFTVQWKGVGKRGREEEEEEGEEVGLEEKEEGRGEEDGRLEGL